MYQLTPAQSALLDQIASGYFVTAAQLSAALTGLSGVGPAVWQTSVISGGTATVSARQGRMTYVKFDTSGLSLEDLDTIAFGSAGLFADGDFLVCSLVSTARNVNLTSASNAVIKGGTWQMRDTDHTALLIWRGTTWQTVALSPEIVVNTMARNVQYVDSTAALGTVAANAGLVEVIELGAEILAQGEVTITGGGGNISVYVVEDPAVGSFLIGTYFMPIVEPVATATTNLAAAITTLGTGYTAANVANVCRITAPIGSGASANAYTLSVVIDGTAAATVTAIMGATTTGADGTETNCTLSYISGGADTQTIVIKNGMASATVTLGNVTGGGGVNSSLVLAAGERTILQKDSGTWEPFVF